MFLETSEDLYMRAFDTRVKPFKPIVEFKVDTNFATSCDLWSQGGEDQYLVTGHRGFNGAGAEVKLWDLRKVLAVELNETPSSDDLTQFVYGGHQFTPESVRFVKPLDTRAAKPPEILTASKDSTMKVLTMQGECLGTERGIDGFACMDVLANAPFAPSNRVIVTADIKQRLQVYLFDEDTKSLPHHPLNYN